MANQKQAARAAAAAQQKAAQAKNDKRNMIIGIIAVLLVAAVGLWAVLGGKDKPAENNQPQATVSGPTAASTITEKVTHEVVIEVQDYGTIKAVLYGEAAPITVANFVKLVEDGFYDGLTFHRIMEGFMMQGGCPEGTGFGGSDEKIFGEFYANGFMNMLSHTRGAISMARSNPFNSASSQFFIVHEDSTFLDGGYAVFGYVTEGLDVVDAVCNAAQPIDGNGSIARDAQPVIISVKIRTE